MKVKRILVHVNKALTVLTGTLLLLLISIPVFRSKGRQRIRIPLGVNLLLITIMLMIIAAYGGAFDKPQKEKTATAKASIVAP